MTILIHFDSQKLRVALALLRQEAERHPELFPPTRLRQEAARCALNAMTVRRRWYGPLPCEGCTYYYGSQGLNCAPHPNGPPGNRCLDWSGATPAETGAFYFVEGQGWTWQEYQPGQGWVFVRKVAPEEVFTYTETEGDIFYG